MGLGRKLFAAAPTQMKEFFEIPFARHNDSLPPAYYEALGQFLDQVDEEAGELTWGRTRPELESDRQLVS
jgi:hypothetical protein